MDKTVVRASYEGCLNSTARLSAYATSRPISITEVHCRQDILATDDLIEFCVHTRRFIENVGLKNLLHEEKMETNDGKAPLSLGKTIGCLIHHDTLDIIRCGTRFRMFKEGIKGHAGDDFFKKIKHDMQRKPYSEPITPLVLFQSDRSDGMRLLNLAVFLQVFSEKILLEAIKANHWLQDDFFKDLDMNENDARQLIERIR